MADNFMGEKIEEGDIAGHPTQIDQIGDAMRDSEDFLRALPLFTPLLVSSFLCYKKEIIKNTPNRKHFICCINE